MRIRLLLFLASLAQGCVSVELEPEPEPEPAPCQCPPAQSCENRVCVERCGSGQVDGDEECDPTDPLSVGCRDDCTRTCGDGVLEEPAEECDDGGNTAGDGCSADCLKKCRELGSLAAGDDFLAGRPCPA